MVSLHTVGEPTVYPWLEEAVSIAKNMGIEALISTNGNLTNKLKSVYESNPDWVRGFRLSVDAGTPQTYEKIRAGGKLENVIETCEWISETNKGKRMSRLALTINCAVSEENIKEIATFFRLFSKYTFPEHMRFDLVNSLAPDITYFDEKRLSFPNLYRLNVPCDLVFSGIYFNNEGYATLCCRDYDNQLVIGNAVEQPIPQVWQSEVAQQIRRQHLKEDDLTIPQCKQCYKPRPGVNKALDEYIHLLQYDSPKFDDEEWGVKILDFLKALDSLLGESKDRQRKKAAEILSRFR